MSNSIAPPRPMDAPAGAAVASRASAWLAVCAAVLALVLAPPTGGDFLPAGILGAIADGELVQLVDGTWRTASAGDLVAEGARVRVPDGPVTIRTRDGSLSLATGTEGRLDAGTVEFDMGAVLVESAEGVEVSNGRVTARGRGAWRFDATASPRIGVYDGGVAVRDASGMELSVGALRQADVVERAVAPETVALRYLPTDAWDARLLAAAISVDRQVVRLERSLAATYGGALQTNEFYADFVAVDEVVAAALPGLARLHDGERYGPPAETLVAVVVTALLTERAGLSGQAATDEIRSLRRAGATWGLVLTAHDLGPDSLRAAADEALRSRQQSVAEGTAAPVATDAPDGTAGEGGTGGAPQTGPDEPTPPGESAPPGGEPPPEPPPDDDPSAVDQVQESVDETADEVADLLEPVPGASEAVDDVSDTVGDVGDTVEDTVDNTVEDTVDGILP